MFFSTRPDGSVVEGLSALPVGSGPVLLVGNHQTLAFDLGVLIDEVLREKGVLMRGLAHPLAFRMMGRAEREQRSGQGQQVWAPADPRRLVHHSLAVPGRSDPSLLSLFAGRSANAELKRSERRPRSLRLLFCSFSPAVLPCTRPAFPRPTRAPVGSRS